MVAVAKGSQTTLNTTNFPNQVTLRILIAEVVLVVMADKFQFTIIEENPTLKGLNAFRASFNSICEDMSISCDPDTLNHLGHEGITGRLLLES